MRAFFRFATVLVLVLSLGLHWALLQSVAWVGMLARYSSETSLAEAVNKTFDGHHPCALCKVVQQGRDAEKQSEDPQSIKPGSKMDCGLIWQPLVLNFNAVPERIVPAVLSGSTRPHAPPKPPPRSFLPDTFA